MQQEFDAYLKCGRLNEGFPRVRAEGASNMSRRANTMWKKMLAEHVEPPMDLAIDEALLDYIARRKAAFPDSNV